MLLSHFKSYFQLPDWMRHFYKGVTFRRSDNEKIVYITFDDGCVPEVTPQILDILDHYGVKATFFIVGENVQKYPELYQDILSRGHRVGNHTFNHIKGTKTTTAEYIANVAQANLYLHTDLFRPPYGKMTRQQKLRIGRKYEIVLWDIITHDYDKRISPERIMDIIRKCTRNGSIINFHDSIKASPNTLVVLPQAIEFWQSEGYQFGVL